MTTVLIMPRHVHVKSQDRKYNKRKKRPKNKKRIKGNARLDPITSKPI